MLKSPSHLNFFVYSWVTINLKSKVGTFHGLAE